MSDATRTDTPPRRRRGRRRLLLAGLLVLAAGAGLWAWAAWRLHRDGWDLAAILAETDRADPGWRFEDLEAARDNPPAAENSALMVLAVKERLPDFQELDPAEELLSGHPPEVRLTEDQLAALRPPLAEAGPVLADARRIGRFSRGRYPVDWQPTVVSTVLPSVQTRAVATWLRADALVQADAGDLATALANCRAVLQVSRSIGDEPQGISQVTRVAVRAKGVQLLERLLAQGEPAADGLAEVQRRLEADEPAPLLLIMARGERAAFVRTADDFFAHLSTRERLILTFTPYNGESQTRAAGLRFFNAYVEAARLPSPQWLPRLTELSATLKPETTPLLLGQLTPDVAKMARMVQRSSAQMRCAIAAVAAERFRRDQGRWPASLAELVAAGLLRAVPADPYDLRPLRLKRRPDGLVIYSVGPDGKDDGGTLNRPKPTDPGSDIGFQLWDVPARRRPPLPPKPPAEEPP